MAQSILPRWISSRECLTTPVAYMRAFLATVHDPTGRNHHLTVWLLSRGSNGFPGACGRIPKMRTIGEILQITAEHFLLGKGTTYPVRTSARREQKGECLSIWVFDVSTVFSGNDQMYPDCRRHRLSNSHTVEEYHLPKIWQSGYACSRQKVQHPSKPCSVVRPGAKPCSHQCPQNT